MWFWYTVFAVGCSLFFFFFFKQKTAYEMRISDWSSDVCSSDRGEPRRRVRGRPLPLAPAHRSLRRPHRAHPRHHRTRRGTADAAGAGRGVGRRRPAPEPAAADAAAFAAGRIRGRFVLNAATTAPMHAQRGFTLLEVLVATALLAAGQIGRAHV